MLVRLALVVALLGASASMSGCVFFSNAFWQCFASGGTNKDACSAFSEYLEQSPTDWDGDGVDNGPDECPWQPGNPLVTGCPDRDGDAVPDHRDRCPDEAGFTSDGCNEDIPGVDITPPPVPTGLTAVGQGSRIRLDWDDVVAPDLSGYNVERAAAPGGPYSQITSPPVTASTYDDTLFADPSQRYYYVVTAVDYAGNRSARSAEASAIACQPPECTSAPGGGGASISLATARKAYRATVTGRFVRARSFSARNGVLSGSGLVFTGRLVAAPGAPAGLRRGGWTARMDLSVSGPAARATARGVALAKFGRGGRICLRFTQLMRAGDGGRRRLLGGSFKVIGATGSARQLGSASRFSGKAGPRSAWTLRATGATGKRLPRSLPRACRGL